MGRPFLATRGVGGQEWPPHDLTALVDQLLLDRVEQYDLPLPVRPAAQRRSVCLQRNAGIWRTSATSAAIAASATPQGLRAIQSDWKTPYMQHWSLDIQREVTRNTIVTIGYYGSKGTHLIGVTELNDLPPGKALSSTCAPGTSYFGQTPAPTLVPCQPAGYAFRSLALLRCPVARPLETPS